MSVLKSAVKLVLCAVPVLAVSAAPLMCREDVAYFGGEAYLSAERLNVTAAKGAASSSFAMPGNISVIDKSDIEKLGASSVPDVLRFAQGIIIRDWTGAGRTVTADIRGFGETSASNMLVLVNGRRTNNVDMSPVDWSQIPLAAVERIEIIRGPSAVLYGDNATGGAVNIITSPPPRDGGTALFESGSYERSRVRALFTGSRPDTTYTISASRDSSNGFRTNSGVSAADLGVFIVRENLSYKASLDFGLRSDRYGMPGALSEADWSAGRYAKAVKALNEAAVGDSYAHLVLSAPLWPGAENEISFSSRRREAASYWRDDYDPVWFPDSGELRASDMGSFGNKLTLKETPVGDVIGGAEYYSAAQKITNLTNSDAPKAVAAESRKNTAAFYVENSVRFVEDKLLLVCGARYETASYLFAPAGADEIRISSPSSAFSAAVSYPASDDISLYAKWSSAFRTPSVDEYYSVWSGFNGDLGVQQTNSTEAGVKKKFGRRASGNLSVFSVDTSNEIYYNPAGGVMGLGANENYTRTRRDGAEIGAEFLPSKFYSLRAGYTYIDAKITAGGYVDSKVPAVPAHSAFLVNTFYSGRMSLTLAATYTGERYFISDQKNVSPPMSAFAKADIKVMYNLADGTKMFAGANNAFDAAYAEYGVANLAGTARNYYPAPRRNFFGGVEVSF